MLKICLLTLKQNTAYMYSTTAVYEILLNCGAVPLGPGKLFSNLLIGQTISHLQYFRK